MGVFDVDYNKLAIREDFPFKVEVKTHVVIPLKDGTRLSAKLWLPKIEKPVRGTILEYLPYRKDEFTALRDEIRHRYFAGFGYASIRVDMRGSGSSTGILMDEYTKTEQEDCLEVFDWICRQPWSAGNLAMIGKSWGGFNGLQMATYHHPALKTVISLYSTDDRYADDVHYRGGTLMGSDMLWWASTMFVYNARPPLPQFVGEKWRELWLERLEETPPFVEAWMDHPTRDHYWRHGSICEDYSQIDIPVFLFGGWADAYTNAVFRMMEHLQVPKRAIIGPWSHEFPDLAVPGPRIGYLQECLAWFDKFLDSPPEDLAPPLEEISPQDNPANNSDNHQDIFIIYQQTSVPPQTSYEHRDGEWLDFWKSETQTMNLFKDKKAKITLKNRLYHGLYSGVFCPFGQAGDLPGDQTLENSLATTLLCETLPEDYVIAGQPRVRLRFKSDQKQANLHLRISDVWPDGRKTLVTRGNFNLCHFKGHDNPEELPQESWLEAEFLLDGIGYTIPKGHQIEVSASPNYWPQIWPSPKLATLTLDLAQSCLELPLIHKKVQAVLPFPKPETAKPLEKTILREGSRNRNITYQLDQDRWILEDFSDEGLRMLNHNGMTQNIIYGSTNRNLYEISSTDPLSAHVTCTWTLTLSDQDIDTSLETYSEMRADKDYFYLENRLVAYENKEIIKEKSWSHKVKRAWL